VISAGLDSRLVFGTVFERLQCDVFETFRARSPEVATLDHGAHFQQSTVILKPSRARSKAFSDADLLVLPLVRCGGTFQLSNCVFFFRPWFRIGGFSVVEAIDKAIKSFCQCGSVALVLDSISSLQ